MPRIAIGDLTIDVDVPERFSCEFTWQGSLLAEAGGESFELSAITVEGGSAVNIVRSRAAEAGTALQDNRDDFAAFFDAPDTWLAGFGTHVLVATVNAGPIADFPQLLASVAPAHDPFTDAEKLSIVDLRPSHAPYFQHHHASLENIDWTVASPEAAAELDDFWTSLVETPPEDENAREDWLRAVAVAFGDLLCTRGFTWVLGRDEWGTSLGVVALRGTANVWVVPADFIARRWERKELDFIDDALESITAQVEKMRVDWKNSVS